MHAKGYLLTWSDRQCMQREMLWLSSSTRSSADANTGAELVRPERHFKVQPSTLLRLSTISPHSWPPATVAECKIWKVCVTYRKAKPEIRLGLRSSPVQSRQRGSRACIHLVVCNAAIKTSSRLFVCYTHLPCTTHQDPDYNRFNALDRAHL
jgi:hypothetical protein